MSGWLTAIGPAGTALGLLVLGHVLGDFVFQTDAMATAKHRIRPLVTHASVVIVVHIVAFGPLLTIQTGVIVATIGLGHLLIDAMTGRVRAQRETALSLFFVDQVAHMLVLLGGWVFMGPMMWTETPVVAVLGGVDQVPWAEITTGALYVSAFGFAHVGGNTIVRGILPSEGPDSDEEDLEAGSIIGTLERWIIILLGLVGLWESVAIVVVAKSIARFEELKQRAFAEYFLVGTLASVLVAIALVIGVSVLV